MATPKNNSYGCSWSSRSWLLIPLLLLLTACGTAASHSQPYDVFRGDLLDVITTSVLVDRDGCMAKAGYPELQQTAGRPTTGSFDDLRVTEANFGATSSADARRRGFGRDLPVEPPAVRSTGQNFSDALDRCTQEATAKLGPNTQEVQQRYYDLGNQLRLALRPVYLDKMPDRFAVPVLACLQDKGFISKSKSPDVRTFGVSFGKSARPYVPTARESDLAAAWYDCTTAAGWPRYQLDRALTVEAATVRRLKPQLDELNPSIESLAHKAETVMASSAGRSGGCC